MNATINDTNLDRAFQVFGTETLIGFCRKFTPAAERADWRITARDGGWVRDGEDWALNMHGLPIDAITDARMRREVTQQLDFYGITYSDICAMKS